MRLHKDGIGWAGPQVSPNPLTLSNATTRTVSWVFAPNLPKITGQTATNPETYMALTVSPGPTREVVWVYTYTPTASPTTAKVLRGRTGTTAHTHESATWACTVLAHTMDTPTLPASTEFATPDATRAALKVPAITLAACVAVSNVSSLSGKPTIDGYTLQTNDIVLLVGQTTSKQDGPWAVPLTGTTWTRPAYFATGSVVKGVTCGVINGTRYGGTTWMLAAPTAGITIGTSNQIWWQSPLGGVQTFVPGLVLDGKTDNHAALTAAQTKIFNSPAGWGYLMLPQGAIATSAWVIKQGVVVSGSGEYKLKTPPSSPPHPATLYGTVICPATGATYTRAVVTVGTGTAASSATIRTLSVFGTPCEGTSGSGAPNAILFNCKGWRGRNVSGYGGTAVVIDEVAGSTGETAQDGRGTNLDWFQFTKTEAACALGVVTAPAYSSGTTYGATASVTHAGVVYISKLATNVGHTPASSPTQWKTAYTSSAHTLTVILSSNVNKTLIVKGAPVLNTTHSTAAHLGNGPYVSTTATVGSKLRVMIKTATGSPAATDHLLFYRRWGARICSADCRITGASHGFGGFINQGGDTHVCGGFHATKPTSAVTTNVTAKTGSTLTLSSVKGIIPGSAVSILLTPVTGTTVENFGTTKTYAATQVVFYATATHDPIGHFYVSKVSSNTGNRPWNHTADWLQIMPSNTYVVSVTQPNSKVTLNTAITRPTTKTHKTLTFSSLVAITNQGGLNLPDLASDGMGAAFIHRISGSVQVGTWNLDISGTPGQGHPAVILTQGGSTATATNSGVSVRDLVVPKKTHCIAALARFLNNAATNKMRWYGASLPATCIPHTGTTATLWQGGTPTYAQGIVYAGVVQTGIPAASTSLPITVTLKPNLSAGSTITQTGSTASKIHLLGMAKSSSTPSVYTPSVATKVAVSIVATIKNTTSGTISVGVRFGTGTPPTHGATTTGSKWKTNSGISWRATTHLSTWTYEFEITVTPGTEYWVDLCGHSSAVSKKITFGFVSVRFQETH